MARKKIRIKRAWPQIYLDTLQYLIDEMGREAISNKLMRDNLGWDEDRYNRIRQGLLDDGAIALERMHGGGVRLSAGIRMSGVKKSEPSQPEVEGIEIFVSYSHKDKDAKDALMAHLSLLNQDLPIAIWHDGQIMPGDEWESEIFNNLSKADVVLLLISVDFMTSSFCNEELDLAVKRHHEKKSRVIPILMRDCNLGKVIDKLQHLPEGGKPISRWDYQDEAYTRVSRDLQKVLEAIVGQRSRKAGSK